MKATIRQIQNGYIIEKEGEEWIVSNLVNLTKVLRMIFEKKKLTKDKKGRYQLSS